VKVLVEDKALKATEDASRRGSDTNQSPWRLLSRIIVISALVQSTHTGGVRYGVFVRWLPAAPIHFSLVSSAGGDGVGGSHPRPKATAAAVRTVLVVVGQALSRAIASNNDRMSCVYVHVRPSQAADRAPRQCGPHAVSHLHV
jgi:hypothetical protein